MKTNSDLSAFKTTPCTLTGWAVLCGVIRFYVNDASINLTCKNKMNINSALIKAWRSHAQSY